MFGQEDFLTDFPTGTHTAVTLAEARVPLIAAPAGISAAATPHKATADEVFRATAQELKHAEWMLDALEEDNLLQLHGVLQGPPLHGPPMARRAHALRSQHESRGLSAPASADDTGPARVGCFPR